MNEMTTLLTTGLQKDDQKYEIKWQLLVLLLVISGIEMPKPLCGQSVAIRCGYPFVNQKAGKHHSTAGPGLKTTTKKTVACSFIFEFLHVVRVAADLNLYSIYVKRIPGRRR